MAHGKSKVLAAITIPEPQPAFDATKHKKMPSSFNRARRRQGATGKGRLVLHKRNVIRETPQEDE